MDSPCRHLPVPTGLSSAAIAADLRNFFRKSSAAACGPTAGRPCSAALTPVVAFRRRTVFPRATASDREGRWSGGLGDHRGRAQAGQAEARVERGPAGDRGVVRLAPVGRDARGLRQHLGASWLFMPSSSIFSASARSWEIRDSVTPSCSASSRIGRSSKKQPRTTFCSRSGREWTASRR